MAGPKFSGNYKTYRGQETAAGSVLDDTTTARAVLYRFVLQRTDQGTP